MDRFRRFIFPALIFIILIIALLYRLSSCSSSVGVSEPASDAAPTPSLSSETASPPPSKPSPSKRPEVRYTDEDIRLLFEKEGYAVKEIRTDVDATIVQFYTPGEGAAPATRFAWLDRETGAREIVSGWLPADKFEITPRKTLTVLTTGASYVNGKQMFPEIFTSTYDPGSDMQKYSGTTEPYFMPVSQSFTVGDDRFVSIRSVVFDYDAVSVGFAPQPGHEAEFELPYRSMPKTGVVCSGGCCYVTFYNTTLPDGFKSPEAGDGDGLRSFVSIGCDGTNTLLTLTLGEKTARYGISSGCSPDDGMPYAVLRFRASGVMAPVYPAGW